jgi:hypothetical protein
MRSAFVVQPCASGKGEKASYQTAAVPPTTSGVFFAPHSFPVSGSEVARTAQDMAFSRIKSKGIPREVRLAATNFAVF